MNKTIPIVLMKIFFYLLMLMLVITGCKKTTVDSANQTVSIVGRWQATGSVSYYYLNNALIYTDNATVSSSANPNIIEFNNNGLYTYTEYNEQVSDSFIVKGTYSLTDDNNVLNQTVDVANSKLVIYSQSNPRISYNYATETQFSRPIIIADQNKFTITNDVPILGAYSGPPPTTGLVYDKQGRALRYDKQKTTVVFVKN